MARYLVGMLLGLCAMLPLAPAARAQLPFLGGGGARPDPVAYGTQVEAGNVAQVREWLDAGMDPDYVADRIGTGLMIAAWNGDLPMMALLVARGADVNRANAMGERALMHAAWRGQLKAIEWLLARGARVNSEPMTWSALHYAVFAGHKEAAALLLARGADLNARSTNGSSVLMMAVYEGHEALAKDLVARGADLTVKNDRGEGALEWAFKFQRLGLARVLAPPQEFAAAANRPGADWGPAVRSLPTVRLQPPSAQPDPLAERIDELVRMRNTLASRGMDGAAAKLDARIARLRAQRARADRASTPPAVLEISARRGAPQEQRTRILFDAGGPPP